MFPDPNEAPPHTDEACAPLLERLFLPLPELMAAVARGPWADASEREVVDLVGRVLWDVLSNNHTVFDHRGQFDLGSFRAAARFLAEEVNVRYRQPGPRRDYLDFYLGTTGMGRAADLAAVYRRVFAGLRAAGGEWCYSFPRVYLVSFDRQGDPGDAPYDPSAAVAAELDAANRARERDEIQERLDAAHDEAVAPARRRLPPPIVQAYRDVAILPERSRLAGRDLRPPAAGSPGCQTAPVWWILQRQRPLGTSGRPWREARPAARAG